MPNRQSLFRDIENAIAQTRDETTFIQRLLIDALGWEIDESATDIEDISFDWSASDLRAEGLDEKIADGTIRQLRPMAELGAGRSDPHPLRIQPAGAHLATPAPFRRRVDRRLVTRLRRREAHKALPRRLRGGL